VWERIGTTERPDDAVSPRRADLEPERAQAHFHRLEVSKLLMEHCAGTVKKMSLELGGNAPFTVLTSPTSKWWQRCDSLEISRCLADLCVANAFSCRDAFTKRPTETACAVKVPKTASSRVP
jgi:hypothetical protein